MIIVIPWWKRQQHADKNSDTCKDSLHVPTVPTGSIVAVQREDGSLGTDDTVMGHGSEDHKDRSYSIQVTKAGHVVM